jgi:hypothetical protein
MKGQDFVPHDGEGIVYLKMVYIKPSTMREGDPAQLVEDAKGILLCGNLNKVRVQVETWMRESAARYLKEVKVEGNG